jgi:hypothetical protein
VSAPNAAAEFDQLVAQARIEADALRQTLANLRAQRGDIQGTADLMAMLMTWEKDRLVSALTVNLMERP